MSLFSKVKDNKEVGLLLPDNIAWDFIFPDGVLEAIPSKSKRKILRKTEKLLSEQGITQLIQPIETEQQFLSFLKFFITAHVEKGQGYVSNEQWFKRNKDRGRQLESLQLWKGESLVGLKMYSHDKHGFYLSHKATLREYDKLIDLGLVIDYLSFLRAQELGYKTCSVGKGINLLGLQDKMSLYEYKVSLGLHLRIANNSIISKIHFYLEDLLEPFVAYCIINEREKLFFVHPDRMKVGSIQRYKPVNKEIEPMSYTNFCLLQR
jgi:hypothetical protein